MTVALVVLNWNGREILERFLPEMLQYSKEATIYVIDNNSLNYMKEKIHRIHNFLT